MSNEADERLMGMLVAHPGWVALGRIVAQEIRRREQKVCRQLVSLDPVDQRECDFTRGFRAGCLWITDSLSPEARKDAV